MSEKWKNSYDQFDNLAKDDVHDMTAFDSNLNFDFGLADLIKSCFTSQ